VLGKILFRFSTANLAIIYSALVLAVVVKTAAVLLLLLLFFFSLRSRCHVRCSTRVVTVTLALDKIISMIDDGWTESGAIFEEPCARSDKNLSTNRSRHLLGDAASLNLFIESSSHEDFYHAIEKFVHHPEAKCSLFCVCPSVVTQTASS
jgi:hypothetical protein